MLHANVCVCVDVQYHLWPLCTIKLHIVVCHLPDQELCYGPTPGTLEFWVERLMQAAKRAVHGRSTALTAPAVFVHHVLVGETLRSLKREYPAHCLDEPEAAARKKRNTARRDDGDENDYMVLGAGHEEWDRVAVDEDEELEAVLSCMTKDPASYRAEGWPVPDKDDDNEDNKPLDSPQVQQRLVRWRYARAQLGNGVQVGSKAKLTKATRNDWTYIHFEDVKQKWVLQVQYYVRMAYSDRDFGENGTLGALGPAAPLRFAIVRAWHATQVDAKQSPGVNLNPALAPELLRVINARAEGAHPWILAVDLHSMTCVLPTTCVADVVPDEGTIEDQPKEALFVRSGKANGAWTIDNTAVGM